MKYAVRSLVIWVSYWGHFDSWGHLTVKTHRQGEPPLVPTLLLSHDRLRLHDSSLSLFSLLHCYFFSMIFSHFSTLSLHSLLCASSIFSPFITPYASHPHLFLYASISASRVIIEGIFPPPLRFLFSLCFSSVFLYLILILLFFTIAIFVFMFSSLCSSSSHRLLLSSLPNSCSFDIDCYDF